MHGNACSVFCRLRTVAAIFFAPPGLSRKQRTNLYLEDRMKFLMKIGCFQNQLRHGLIINGRNFIVGPVASRHRFTVYILNQKAIALELPAVGATFLIDGIFLLLEETSFLSMPLLSHPPHRVFAP